MIFGKSDDEQGEFPYFNHPENPRKFNYSSILGTITYGVIVIGLSLVLLRAAWMQVVEKDYWQSEQAAAQSRVSIGDEKRGKIVDRKGRPMAMDREIHRLAVDPNQLSRLHQLSAGEVLVSPEIPVSVILQQLSDAGLELWGDIESLEQDLLNDIRRNLQVDRDNQGKKKRYRVLGELAPGSSRHDLDGPIKEIQQKLGKVIFPPLESYFVRHYPFGRSGTILIGEMIRGNSGGLWGMESSLNSHLLKVTGLQKQQVAPGGGKIDDARYPIPGHHGKDMHTTIDMHLQAELEHLCYENYQRTSARSVSAIVIDPFTAEIHALATVPGLERGQLTEFANQDQLNGNSEGMKKAYDLMVRLHRVSIEPGSVVKPLILARALELGIPLDLPLPVNGKNQRLDGRRRLFRDSSLLLEKTPEGAVVFSSNIGMVLLGVKHMKKSDVESILRRFGFGSRTGIELPGEEVGLLQNLSRWSRFSWESACYGYEMMVTPMQVLRAYMAIANGGYLMQPTLLADSTLQPAQIILTEQVAGECRRVLGRAVKDGTGQHVVKHVGKDLKFLIEEGHLQMAGKTGTTKLLDPETGTYSENLYNSSFVGFAPVENARFLTVVLVEEPTPEGNMYYASKSAAPLGAQILAAAMNLTGFDPFAVEEEDPRDSEALNLAGSPSAGNLIPSGSQMGPAQDSGQEGEPDQW